jgi:hypothetical protein
MGFDEGLLGLLIIAPGNYKRYGGISDHLQELSLRPTVTPF